MGRTSKHRKNLVLTVCFLLLPAFCTAQSSKFERVYPYSAAEVNQALHDLDAFSGAKLPVVEGFTKADPAAVAGVERPYYQFKIEVVSQDPGHTLLRVLAKITASYTDSGTGHSEYRELPSSGRLENDLFDRLQDTLKRNPSQLPADEVALQQQQADLEVRRKELEQEISRLQREIKPGEKPFVPREAPSKIGVVKGQGIPVLDHPAKTGRILFRVGPGDEFEVLEENADWFGVKLGEKSRGWVRRSQLDLVESKDNKPISPPAAGASDRNFDVGREEVETFRGNWALLKGRKAIFVYAQTKSPASREEKLAFAKRIFTERYLQASHSNFHFDGVVIAFDSGRELVAATLSNIQAWVNGSLADTAFLNRCWVKLAPR